MKVFNFFAHIFAIFSFLTLGSLLIIVGLHILSLEHAVMKIHQVYASPWKSMQALLIGSLFIAVGLAFTRMLLKKGKTDAIIIQSERGPIVVSANAIEDVTRKVLKRFHLIKDGRVSTTLRNKEVSLTLRLVLWSGSNVQELLAEIQEEIRARLRKFLGPEAKIEIKCDVQRIEDHEAETERVESHAAVS